MQDEKHAIGQSAGITCSAPRSADWDEIINEEDKSWLVTVPASDINFKLKLKFATAATVRAALETVRERGGLNKSKINALERRLRFLRRWRADVDAAKEKYLAATR